MSKKIRYQQPSCRPTSAPQDQKYAAERRLQLSLLINVYVRFLSAPCPAVYFHLLLFTSRFEKERKKFAFDI